MDEIITIRALEGSYPNYSQLLPEKFENELEFDRKEFIASLERIAVLADQHNNVIKVTTDGSAVEPSATNAVLLVDVAPACNRVSDIAANVPLELTCDSDTDGLVEYRSAQDCRRMTISASVIS